ncbi:MAG: YggU family protein [Deltaproteobacteria bacterium]|nr:YggU family protein [Deltaproteobacteria bacterium]
MSAYPFLKETAAGVTLSLRAQPRAKKSEIVGQHGGALKVKIAAPPVEGAANGEIIAFFAKLLGIPRSSISIERGGQSRHKVLRLRGASAAQITETLRKRGVLA